MKSAKVNEPVRNVVQKTNQIYLLHLQLQTFILFSYGEWIDVENVEKLYPHENYGV